MHLASKLASRTVFTTILLVMMLFPATLQSVNAQTANYYVTVNPTTADSLMYTPVDSNWTISFEAAWSYGADSGTPIENAVVTVQVNNSINLTVDTLQLNMTAGTLSFNYTSSKADMLTFTPTKLVTQDGTQYTTDVVGTQNSVYGLQSTSAVVWWDTFQASLVGSNTDTSGNTTVEVNISYLLLPQEGLTLPEWATYSNQTFLPKDANNVNVTINGVPATQTLEGTFTATVPTWLPTAYVNVQVSQEGWTTTNTGFSFVHNANQPTWLYPGIISLAIVAVVTLVLLKKDSFSKKNYPNLGAVLLALTSFVSLYWGLVGLDSTLHGFDWTILTATGLFSFVFGLAATLLALRKKLQPLVITAITAPLITNLIAVHSALDTYALTTPWLILIAPFVLSVLSAFMICNADEQFM